MSKKHRFLFVVCLLAACLTQFASDIYAPSLPNIASELGTAIKHVQWSMAVYLIGVAVSLLFYGPLSESFGRKKPFVTGLIILFIGSCISWAAPDIETLILGRFIQGCGAGAAAGLWGAIFRDLFSGNELAKFASLIATFIMFSLSLAPLVGGILEEYWHWRASFAFIAIYTLLTLIATLLWYPETNLQRHKNKLSKDFILASYKELFSHPLFLGITLCNFLSYGAYFSIFIVTPLLLIRDVGISPIHYGILVCFGSAIAYLLAGYLNTRYVLRFGTANMMRFGWMVMTLSGILLWLLPNFIDFDEISIGAPMILFFFGSTFIWPNAFATALTPFPHIAGYASVSYRLMLLGGGAVIGSLISYLPTDTTTPLSCVLIICSLLAWRIYEKLVVQK